MFTIVGYWLFAFLITSGFIALAFIAKLLHNPKPELLTPEIEIWDVIHREWVRPQDLPKAIRKVKLDELDAMLNVVDEVDDIGTVLFKQLDIEKERLCQPSEIHSLN